MSGNNGYLNQLAEASRDMEGASLTIGARIDDDFADTIRETMRLPQFRDGAKASDLSIAIFGDTGNSHVLAVDTRLLMMRDAGEVTWERGLFRFIEDDDDDRDGTFCQLLIDGETLTIEMVGRGDGTDPVDVVEAFMDGRGSNAFWIIPDRNPSLHGAVPIARTAADLEDIVGRFRCETEPVKTIRDEEA